MIKRFYILSFITTSLFVLKASAFTNKHNAGRLCELVYTPAFVSTENYKIHGIDISHYQKRIDWDLLSNARINGENKLSFVFIRATMGSNRSDNLFYENWNGAKRTGVKRAAYHFFDHRQSAVLQVNNFLRSVKFEPGDLPPVLDVEIFRSLRRKKDVVRIQNAVGTWLKMVEKAVGVKPIIYTSYRFYKDYLSVKFNNYPVWLAYYNYEQPLFAASPYNNWHFWQHTDRGRIDGISGDVDMNVFAGEEEHLNSLCVKEKKKNFIELPVKTTKNTSKKHKR